MYRSTIALSAIALAAVGWQDRDTRPPLGMTGETVTLEYSVSQNEVVVIAKAESDEGLDGVEIKNPSGVPVFRLRAGESDDSGLSGFMVETTRSSPESLFSTYNSGVYEMRARTLDGRRVVGSATLSHDLLAAPIVVFPPDGAVGVPTSFLVQWVPDPEAVAYRIGLEQGDSDGLVVELPPGSSSFLVPAGVLASDTETFVEVGAVSSSGNSTIIESAFRTL